MTRIDDTFARLRAEGRKAFVAYIMAGDPDRDTSMAVMAGLPGAGVDIIELGMPFTDPMADGPTIQLAGQRALEGGQTLAKTLFPTLLLLLPAAQQTPRLQRPRRLPAGGSGRLGEAARPPQRVP